jgi:hypothetical protein
MLNGDFGRVAVLVAAFRGKKWSPPVCTIAENLGALLVRSASAKRVYIE